MKRRWSVSDEVLTTFQDCTTREQERLLDFFQRLAESPAEYENHHDRGPDARLYSVAHFAPWIMPYWVEPDGQVVRVVELEIVR